MGDVTVQDLRFKVDCFLDIREQIKDLEFRISDLNKFLQPIQKELQEIMEAMDMTRFEGTKGKVTMVKVDYVNSPQTEEGKAAFFNYLKAQNLFEDMASINYQRLNSFYKSKLEEAIEQGHELNIPGLEPKQRVEIRKSR